MRTRGLVKFGAIIGVMASLLSSAPCAVAEPLPVLDEASGAQVLTAPTLSLADLGADRVISFYGETSTADLSFPVLKGLVPATLNVVVDLPFNIRSGLLSVTQDDRVISKQPLPTTDLAPLVIPLSGLEVTNDVATISLRLATLPEDGYCQDRYNPIQLIDGSVTFTGVEAVPATVADFLPTMLRKLTIALPASPSMAESDATVQLATGLAHRYRDQGPEITVVPLANGAPSLPAPSRPMERQIVVKEGPEESLSLVGSGVPQLLITGPADKLTHDTRLLTDGLLNMAVSSKVVPEKLSSGRRTQPLGDVTTVARLNPGQLSASGLSPQVTIGLDQTKFAHPIQGVRVHLLGSYTPLPNNFGAQLTASVNGEQIDSWSAAGAGTVDRWIDVPDRLLNRNVGLQVAVNTTGDAGGCNDFSPLTLTINGDSVIQTSVASPPIPPGFGSVPQSLMPAVKVGIGSDVFADTVRAAEITVGLQRLSGQALRTSVTSFDEARNSQDPAILISADGWTDKSITLPVSADGGRVTLQGQAPADEQTVLDLDPGIRFGSLQTIFDGRRTLVIATSNGAPAELDQLLGWLNADRGRWPQLRGPAIVSVAGRTPALVDGRNPLSVYGPDPTPDQGTASPAGSYHYDRAWWVAAALVGVALAGVAVIVLTSRRPREFGATHRRDS